jgi:folate-binding protein YgfZ
MTMHKGPLSTIHRKEARSVGEYHGWEMPGEYSSSEQEFDAARARAALVDRSFLSRLRVGGADRLDLLHRLSTNDLQGLRTGEVRGTVFTTEKGRIVDAVWVGAEGDSLVVLGSAADETKLHDWIEKYHITEDITMSRLSSETTVCSILGPHTNSTIKSFFGVEFSPGSVRRVKHATGEFLLLCTERGGLPIADLIVANGIAPAVWGHMRLEGKRLNLETMGSTSYEAFRVTRGIPSGGHELVDAFTPYDVGLTDMVSFTKGCYVGQEVIARLDTYGKVRRRLAGLVFHEAIETSGSPVPLFHEEREVGVLTSVAKSPVRGAYVALGAVGGVLEGDRVAASCGGRMVPGVVLTIPILV